MHKVIDIALGELGYTESPGNVNKYAAALDVLPGFYNGTKNGYPWCDVFVDWCFVTAYGVETAKKLLCQPDYSAGAGCTYSARYYQQAGRWCTTPQVGAQVFFGNYAESTHTGLVCAVDDTYVYTVEGNTSDGVYKRMYRRDDGGIYGYGLPDYALVEDTAKASPRPTETGDAGYAVAYDGEGENDEVAYVTPDKPKTAQATCRAALPELSLGDESGAVAAMQTLLALRDCPCGGADGEFGPLTDAALTRFQRQAGLAADGVCGEKTWTALIGAAA